MSLLTLLIVLAAGVAVHALVQLLLAARRPVPTVSSLPAFLRKSSSASAHSKASPSFISTLVPSLATFLPYVGCGLEFVPNPRGFCERWQAMVGDSFFMHLFGIDMLCVFGPVGVKSLYHVKEKDASFTEATKGLLGLKLPSELLEDNSLIKFHQGLRKHLLPSYLRTAVAACQAELATLTLPANKELFPLCKNMVHAIGLQCWIGGSLDRQRIERLVQLYEGLDPESGFSDLRRLTTTIFTSKLYEKRAFDAWAKELRDVWEERGGDANLSSDADNNLAALHSLYSGFSSEAKKIEDDTARARQVAKDVFHFHLASQANLYAATAWTLINLLLHPDYLERVSNEVREALRDDAGKLDFSRLEDPDTQFDTLEKVMLESLRLAQQSITLRKVLKPEGIDVQVDGGASCHLPQGAYLMTLLSVTNFDPRAVEGLSDTSPLTKFDPERFVKSSTGRFTMKSAKEAESLVSMYGHGSHACPGRTLATRLAAIIIALLITQYDIELQGDAPKPPPAAVGAVARSAEPAVVSIAAKK